jgi:hypothetical protein
VHTKRLKLCRNDRANCRNGYTLEGLNQFRFSAGGAGDFAESANLGRACEGNRIDLACGHIVHYRDHARIVDFRDVDIGKHWIWHSPGSYDEIHQSRIRIARIELHTDGAPVEVEPPHRCDNTFGGGFIRRNIGV